jgi:two-component system, response regulator
MERYEILLVEDNNSDIEMIMDTISEKNLDERVIAVKNGKEAIDYFFGPQGCLHGSPVYLPKMILLDLKLPKINGFQVLKRLKADERTRQIPVVIFTSSDQKSDKDESYALGVNSYIVKPMDADVYADYISDIVRYWMRINRTAYDYNHTTK